MQKVPLWKPLLILATLALSLICIYPPKERLKLGLDLQGGTTLVYQVNVPDDSKVDTTGEIDDTIKVSRDRIDPTGVKNLVWRQIAGGRIEIQMAHASPEIKERRERFIKSRDALFANSISRVQLEAALRANAAARPPLFDSLAGGNAEVRKLIDQAATAYDAMEQARGPYEAASQQRQQAEKQLEKLPADADGPRKDLEREIATLHEDVNAKTRAYATAKKGYEQLREKVLAANIDSAEFERITNLPRTASEENKQIKDQRQAAIDKLTATLPHRAEQIKQVIADYDSYEQIKGPLDDPERPDSRPARLGRARVPHCPRADVPDLPQLREQLKTRGPRALTDKRYKWLPIDNLKSFAEKAAEQKLAKENPEAYFASSPTRPMIAQGYGDQIYMLVSNMPESSMTHEDSDWKLVDAKPQPGSMGLPVVSFELDIRGGENMRALTEANVGKPMAIVLDDKVMSAPNIKEPIGGRGQIDGGSGGYTQPELDYLVRTLKAGSLKARLTESPISIQTTGPQFGRENLHNGIKAALWATAVICVFMMVYYFMIGLVACFALVANIVLVLGVMAIRGEPFTLSGIAGVVLTIGLAVDSNVLIYERIREELGRGIELRRAINLGFQRAFTTIIDSHITTLITCVILYYTATADIKGFAIALGIGLVANLFTSVFCSRVIIDLYVHFFKPHTITMLPTKFPAITRAFTPNIDWVGKRHFYIGFSVVLTIICLAGIVKRGEDFLDIEFRSGTQVTFELGKDAQGNQKLLTTGDVRKRLEEAAKLPNMELLRDATPVTVGDVQGEKASQFRIQTLITDAPAVSNAIKTAFADVLDVQRPIAFAKMGEGNEVPPMDDAPVFAIREANLGANIGRSNITTDVSPFLGGVAILLDDMDPPQTIEQVTQRIKRLGAQPEFENLGYHPPEVIGLLADTSKEAGADAGQRAYRSVVVLFTDQRVNYADNPESVKDKSGFAANQWRIVHQALRRDTSLAGVSNFSSQISATMQQQAIVAVVLSWLAILAYLWFRFGSVAYGLGAVAALVHDVIVAVGLAAWAFYIYDSPIGRSLLLMPFRVDLTMIAAVLTLIGYSVNDTIVIFDRIRENRGKLSYASRQVINDSINQTFSRSILTVATVLVAVFFLYVIGGPGVHNFAFVMLVGAVIGCYSSIAVASPLLLLVKHTPEQETGVTKVPAPVK